MQIITVVLKWGSPKCLLAVQEQETGAGQAEQAGGRAVLCVLMMTCGSSLQVKSPTSAPGMAVTGALPAPMS